MRYGNIRPSAKKYLIKKIKRNEKLLNDIANADLDNRSEIDIRLIERRFDRAIEENIDVEAKIRKGDYTLKPFKRRRNISLDKVKDIVLKHITLVLADEERRFKNISKEEIAREYEIKEHLVEQVFHILNREGILGQRKANYAHDTNRNPIFDGSQSGWAEDTYSILIKNEV